MQNSCEGNEGTNFRIYDNFDMFYVGHVAVIGIFPLDSGGSVVVMVELEIVLALHGVYTVCLLANSM